LHRRQCASPARVRAYCTDVDLSLDPKWKFAFLRLGSYRDGAHDCHIVTVENYPFNVIDKKMTVRVEIGTRDRAASGIVRGQP
jgi:hypothetical protein